MTGQNSEQQLLEVKGLQKSYKNSEGLKDLVIDIEHLSLHRGEQLFLEGGSGTGKTTLLNLLAGILKADKGSIRIKDIELTQLNENKRDIFRGQQIGLLFQRFYLLPGLNILENVALATGLTGKSLNWKRSREILTNLELENKLNHLPGQLSIGQQQRVALARALVNRPALVLADEPTSSLDPRLSTKTIELIRSSCEADQAALVVVSHDLALSDGFSRKVRLEELNKESKALGENS